MKKRNDNFITSKMYCCNCGHEGIPIMRKLGQYREPGHLKKIYCPYCNKEWNHVEIRPFYSDYNYEDFKLEIKYNNFNENGDRKEPYKIFRKNLKIKIIKGEI